MGYINVDLDLRTKFDPGPLVAAFQPWAMVISDHFDGETYRITIELMSKHENANGCIREFVARIAKLPLGAMHFWRAANERIFDIGIQSGLDRKSIHQRLALNTLLAVSELGAEIAVTVYQPDVDESPEGMDGDAS